MKNEKGISMWAVILLIAVLIGAAILWSKYFAKPMATVMMGGAEQAQPAIEKAHKASDMVNQVNVATEKVAKEASEDMEKEK
jgi:archaellum component FlaF (FlaF/FlaG flagellin family)